MYVIFPALNDNMTSKREKTKWKTIDSFFTKPVSTETKDSSDNIASTEESISKESLPERIDDSEDASSVSTVTSKDSAPPYPDISSLQDSKLQMTDVKMQLLTANWKDVNDFDFSARIHSNITNHIHVTILRNPGVSPSRTLSS